jgi:hypothetical protein
VKETPKFITYVFRMCNGLSEIIKLSVDAESLPALITVLRFVKKDLENIFDSRAARNLFDDYSEALLFYVNKKFQCKNVDAACKKVYTNAINIMYEY